MVTVVVILNILAVEDLFYYYLIIIIIIIFFFFQCCVKEGGVSIGYDSALLEKCVLTRSFVCDSYLSCQTVI